MARKTQAEKVAEAAVAAALKTSDEVEVLEDENEEQVQDALSTLRDLEGGEQAVWQVSCIRKFPPDPDAIGKIESIDATNLNFDYFRSRYGAGEYKVVAYLNGKYIRGSHAKIKVSNIGITQPREAAQSGPDAGDLLTRLESQRLAREESERRAKSERMKDWAGIVGSLGLGSILAAVIARKPAFDPVQLMIAMQSNQLKLADVLPLLEKRNEAPAGLETTLKVLDVLQDKLGNNSGESTWIDLVRDTMREIIPAAKPLLENLAAQRQQPQPAALPYSPPPGHPIQQNGMISSNVPGNSSAPLPAPTETDMLTMIRPFLLKKCEELLEAARENRNVELCAEWLLESIPKMYRAAITSEQLRELLSRADWWAQLAQFYPQLQPYQGWVDEVRQEVIRVLEDEITEQTSTQEAPRHVQ